MSRQNIQQTRSQYWRKRRRRSRRRRRRRRGSNRPRAYYEPMYIHAVPKMPAECIWIDRVLDEVDCCIEMHDFKENQELTPNT